MTPYKNSRWIAWSRVDEIVHFNLHAHIADEIETRLLGRILAQLRHPLTMDIWPR